MNNKIYPCLWFNNNAKEATEFYCSVFKDSVIKDENPIVVTFESAGQKFMCLNGGPYFTINPSISFYVACQSENELDIAWQKLIQEGSVLMPLDRYPWSEKYGWLQDKFGVNWQLSFGSNGVINQKYTPVLMFSGSNNGKAEQAIQFYTSIFDNSNLEGILRYNKGENEIEGAIKHAQFKLSNRLFMIMDSSLDHKLNFNEAISFVVECETQHEIDYYWEKLSAVPEAEQCGWLKDKYGISWQIVPAILKDFMKESERAQRVTSAFMKMKKLDIEILKNA